MSNENTIAHYIAVGSVRGECGHHHRTAHTAQACVDRDQRACARLPGGSGQAAPRPRTQGRTRRPPAARDHGRGIARVAAAAGDSGDSHLDLLAVLLSRALRERLATAAQALWEQVAPLVAHGPSDEADHMPDVRARRALEPLLDQAARPLAKLLLSDLEAEVAAVERQMIDAYYADGTIGVDIPVAAQRA